MSDPVVVTVAISGVLANKEQCPAIPYTPAEYAAEAKRCVDAGCSVIHIHAREADGSPSHRWQAYRDIRDAILAETDVIINFSTGGFGPREERIEHIERLRPDLGAVNMGSMNYAKYSRRQKAMVFDHVFQNPFEDIVYYLNKMRSAGVKPELECFDIGHTNSIEPLLDMGVLHPPLQFSFIMGVLGGIKATADNLACQTRQIPQDSTWEVIGIGLDQWRMIAAGLDLGGNIRVGVEDNFYLEPGLMARSNAELVEKAVGMAHDVGRVPSSAEQAAVQLGLPQRNALDFIEGTLEEANVG